MKLLQNTFMEDLDNRLGENVEFSELNKFKRTGLCCRVRIGKDMILRFYYG